MTLDQKAKAYQEARGKLADAVRRQAKCRAALDGAAEDVKHAVAVVVDTKKIMQQHIDGLADPGATAAIHDWRLRGGGQDSHGYNGPDL